MHKQEKINKKVIFLLPILGGGGGERVASDLTQYLPENIEKIIVAFEVKDYYKYNGKIISLEIKLSTNIILKIYTFLKGYFKFKKIIAEEKPDYVISFGSLQNILNIISTKKAIVRIDNPILVSHRKFIEKLYPIFVKLLFNKAKRIIVVSRRLKEELIKKFKIKEEKISVIYNSVDIEKIKKLAQEPIEPEFKKVFDHPVIINIGSLIPQKDQESLIRAFKKVKEEIIDAKLVILGDGVLEKKLKKITSKLGLENDTHFLGWQENPFKFLARSKLFVLSSFWEGFGIVLLEAMACGVPIVSSDCDFGPKEILSLSKKSGNKLAGIEYAEYGILFAENAEKEELMCQAIITVLTDSLLQKKFAENAYERVKSFDISSHMHQYKFLEEDDKKISWVFIDRKIGGGFAYNSEVRRIIAQNYKLKTIAIKDRHILFKYFKPFRWMWQLMRADIGGDVLIEESFDTLIFPIPRRHDKKVAIIHHIDNSASPVLLKILLVFAERIFYKNIKKFDLVVTVSEYWRQYFLSIGCKNVVKIYNSFDLESFNITDSDVDAFRNKFNLIGKKIVYIGNCQKAKGVVESYQSLKDLDIFLVTSGERKVNIGAINLNLSYHDYLCLLKASSIVVTMSKFKEGWCRTAHEAMLLRKPVIGSGVGGMKELLESGKQIVCADFNELSNKVEYLLNNPAAMEKMGHDGYEYARNFTQEKFDKEWLNLFKNL